MVVQSASIFLTKMKTKGQAKRVFSLLLTVLGVGGGLFVSSCSWKSLTAWRQPVQPSVLVIFVEGLGFGAISCGEEAGTDQGGGIKAFCEESVRFTHAYTPSTMSQATIASVFTGLQPYQHGVRHNGAQGLSARQVTVAEVARQDGYHTAFFSGGPPIWRKSGVNQGFELFDDTIQISLRRLYRPARDVVNAFLNWQDAEAPRGKFFSALFLSDLQFIDAPTMNEIGELRDSSYRSQVLETGEALGRLVRELKARKVWDSTHVFLVGTNGPASGDDSDVRVEEARPFMLNSGSTRVTLMVKPARLMRETPLNWKIDVSVGLADVGATLFDLIGKPLAPSQEQAAAVSLRSALQGPQPSWDAERLIVSESAWTAWRGSEGVEGVSPEIRFALREGPFLYLNDSTSQLFDTLTDNLEVVPVPESDARSAKVRAELRAFLKPIAPRAWRSPDRVVIEKLELGRELWRARTPRPETLAELKALSKRFPGDEQLLGWRAIWAIRLGNWAELKAAAKQATDRKVDPSDDQSVNFNRNARVWAFVAARNLGEKPEPPGDPCFEFVREKAMPPHLVPKSCSADGLTELLAWRDDSASAAARDRAMQEFLRKYLSKTLASRISEANYVVGLAWDVSIPRLNGPDQVDLALALPEFRKLRSTVLRRVANESSASAAETR